MSDTLTFKPEYSDPDITRSDKIFARGAQKSSPATVAAAPTAVAKPTTSEKVQQASFTMPARRFELNKITMNPGSEMLAEHALVWHNSTLYQVELALAAQQSAAETDLRIDTLVLRGIKNQSDILPLTYWTDYDKVIDIIGTSGWTHVDALFAPKIVVTGGESADFSQSASRTLLPGAKHDWSSVLSSIPDAERSVLMECTDNGEFKFWSAWYDAKKNKIHYAHGRIGDVPGTVGTYANYSGRSMAEAVAYMSAKLKEKLRKGYKRVDGK